MLSKEARKYLARVVIAVELGCFIGAYRVWHMMNISQGNTVFLWFWVIDLMNFGKFLNFAQDS